ncbi:MAG: hypothetical protein KJ779_02280, partial [Firmicutes bacterium]|nr:hypothetical protein [Bacillota bacterium]
MILAVIRSKIFKLTHWEYFPMLIFAFFILLFHLFVSPSGDDITYGTVFYKEPVLTFICGAYNSWSSRIIIMPVAAFFAGNSFGLFSIINVFVYFLLSFMISKLFVYEKNLKTNWVIVFLLACVPFVSMMTTAGWVVTSIHYLWPLTFSLVAIYPIKKIFFRERIRGYEYPLYIVATLFGMNMEIVAAILVTIYLVFAIYFIYKKSLNWYLIIMAIVLLGNIAFIFLCPGNGVREVSEIVANFPEYSTFGFIQKLTVSATSHVFSIDQNFINMVVLAMAWLFCWNKYKSWLPRIIGISPFIFCVLINIFRIIVLSPKFDCLFCLLTGNKIDDWVTFIGITTGYLGFNHYLLLIFMSSFVVSLFLITYLLFKDSNKLGIAVLVMGASIMSRVVMGFSPTVYESGARTFLFQYVAMVIFGLLMYQEFNSLLTPVNQKKLFV